MIQKYRVFISGPMESCGGNMNLPLFHYVAKRLETAGCEVYNPAASFDTDTFRKMEKQAQINARRRGMKRNCDWICDVADVMLMLPGWQQSPGAKAEHALALSLGLTIRECPTILITDYMYGHDRSDTFRLELFEA